MQLSEGAMMGKGQNNKTKFQLIPEKVYQHLDSIVDKLGPGIKGFCHDNLKEVLSIVATHVRKADGAAQLQMVYIKKLVPQGDKYLAGLISLSIIIRSGQPIIGQTSYKYEFAPEYRSRYISVPLNNAKLANRIEMAHQQVRILSAKSLRGHSEQIKYLKLLTISDEYKDFIKSNYTTETDRFNSIMGSATRIINNDIFYSIDKTSGRFHSNLTNMPKRLRPFLRINGEPLINLDIKNSQPYLSTILLTDPGKVAWMTKNAAFALLLQSLKVSLKEDVKSYISLVISGQLYEYLMAEFAEGGLKLNRSQTKSQVLRILFARNRIPVDETNKMCRRIFKSRFPTVHRIFSKVRGSAKGDKFSNFKRFAILLQRIESYLILDRILKRIYLEMPGTIAITIHDSVMTGVLTDNVEGVRKIMMDELTFFVGFAPNISVEDVEKENRTINIKEEGSINSIQYVATTTGNINVYGQIDEKKFCPSYELNPIAETNRSSCDAAQGVDNPSSFKEEEAKMFGRYLTQYYPTEPKQTNQQAENHQPVR